MSYEVDDICFKSISDKRWVKKVINEARESILNTIDKTILKILDNYPSYNIDEEKGIITLSALMTPTETISTNTKNLEDVILDEENQSDLNQRLLNIISQLRKENSGHFQPIRIFFFEENGIMNPILTDLLKEDRIEEYDNYPSYLCTLHKEIHSRIAG